MINFKCPYKGECFAKNQERLVVSKDMCVILKDKPEGDKCPFQKQDASVTRGVTYPYNVGNAVADAEFADPKRPIAAWAEEWDRLTEGVRRSRCQSN